MTYHHSHRMTLKGSHGIIVDARPMAPGASRRVFVMNSRQMVNFSRHGRISADWMPLDHVLELTAERPYGRFEVEGHDHWYVVSEVADGEPPMISLDSGGKDSSRSQPRIIAARDAEDNDDDLRI